MGLPVVGPDSARIWASNHLQTEKKVGAQRLHGLGRLAAEPFPGCQNLSLPPSLARTVHFESRMTVVAVPHEKVSSTQRLQTARTSRISDVLSRAATCNS